MAAWRSGWCRTSDGGGHVAGEWPVARSGCPEAAATVGTRRAADAYRRCGTGPCAGAHADRQEGDEWPNAFDPSARDRGRIRDRGLPRTCSAAHVECLLRVTAWTN